MITPRNLRIDTSTYCQLKCPTCPNKKLQDTDVGRGFMNIEDFKRLLDNDITRVEIGNWGEPFLHPEMLEFLEYAHRRVRIGILSNLNYINHDVIKGLVEYGVEKIVVSLDGVSQETYAQYRVGGDFRKVIENITRINVAKKGKYPELVWQFLVFGHNEHEIPRAKALAKSLGMSWSLALPTEMDFRSDSYECDLSPVRDKDLVRKELGFATLDEQKKKWGAFRDFGVCLNLWDEPAINWDGKVLGCCTSLSSFGGNAFEDFIGSMNTEKMNAARDMVRGGTPRDDLPCFNCLAYKMMERDGTWITRA